MCVATVIFDRRVAQKRPLFKIRLFESLGEFVRNFGSVSGKKREPKPKLFGPDIFRWGGGLPREGVGARKFGMSFETQGNQPFWRDIPGFAGISRGCPKSLTKKRFVFNSRPLFPPPKFQCFSSQCALHGLRALDLSPGLFP